MHNVLHVARISECKVINVLRFAMMRECEITKALRLTKMYECTMARMSRFMKICECNASQVPHLELLHYGAARISPARINSEWRLQNTFERFKWL